MLPGPTIYRECSHCKKPFTQWSLTSGNTFGAVHWSDGKMDADMMPIYPEIVRCPECAELLWIEDTEIVGSCDFFEGENLHEDSPLKDAKSAQKLDMLGFQEAIESEAGSTVEREKYLRIQLWWSMNDLIRYEEKDEKQFFGIADMFKQNGLRLSLLLEQDDDELIMKAELAREIGDFEGCLSILGKVSAELEDVCVQITQLAKEQERLVKSLQLS